MALYQKRRGKNGSVEFFVDGKKVDVGTFVDSSGGKENIYTALRDSKDINQLRFLTQSLGKHSGTQNAIAEINSEIKGLEKTQKAKKRENEAFKALGFDSSDVATMSPEEKRMWTFMGYEKLNQIEEANPIIEPLSEQSLKAVKEQVMNDPGINKFERDSVARLVESTGENVRQLQLRDEQFASNFERRAEENRDILSRQSESLGTTFSPVRQQEVQELEEQEQGIIASFAEDQKQQLQAIGQSIEDRVGTQKTMGQFGDILTLNNTLQGEQVNYNPSSVERTYQDSNLGREVGQLRQNQEQIEVDRLERLAGIK